MKHSWYFALALGLVLPLAAQQPAAAPAPSGVQLIVTALGKHNQAAPAIAASQVQVKQGHNQDAILHWAPFPPDQRMDLAIAIDDDTVGMRTGLDDVKSFISHLPANVAVGILYLHTGSFQVAQNFTLDHAAAAKAVRMPTAMQNASPSPFGSLRDLMHHWPYHPGFRREMILISDGQEHVGSKGPDNQTVQAAIADAVAGGIVVYTIYASGGAHEVAGVLRNNTLVPDASQAEGGPPVNDPGMAGTPIDVFRNSNLDEAHGSQNLSQLAGDTGGEAYAHGIQSSQRLTQYFNDIAARMGSQYRLVIQPNTQKPRGMTRVQVKVHHSDAKITAPEWIYLVPHAKH